MLSYQHIYHAGNFADVQKHAILVKILKAMMARPQKMTVIDTHAGRGLYDLRSDEALKTGEFENGIERFVDDTAPMMQDYLSLVRGVNEDDTVEFYPGTALIARMLMRSTDKLFCIEKHPGEFEHLQRNIKNAMLIKGDGFRELAEREPPQDRRGLMIIDPSYEVKSEYESLPGMLEKAWKKWPTGVFMLWYPMLHSLGHRKMMAKIRASSIKNVLVSEIRFDKVPEQGFAMYGTGIAIINSPLPQKAVEDLTQHIASRMAGKAFADVFWLDNKKINPDSGFVEL